MLTSPRFVGASLPRLPSYARRSSRPRPPEATSEASASVDVPRILQRIRSIVVLKNELVPAENSQNLSLEVWKLIRSIPAKDRIGLLRTLGSSDIIRLWNLSADFYKASSQQRISSIGPASLTEQDFPQSHDDGIATYEGKAAIVVSAGVADRFQKVFAVPRGGGGLVGRVNVMKGPLGNLLYPLYFEADMGPGITHPGTGEPASIALRYRNTEDLLFDEEDLPGSWPLARNPLFPFSAELVDYVRPVGPGVYVGQGWTFSEKNPYGKKFLAFLLVRSPSEV